MLRFGCSLTFKFASHDHQLCCLSSSVSISSSSSPPQVERSKYFLHRQPADPALLLPTPPTPPGPRFAKFLLNLSSTCLPSSASAAATHPLFFASSSPSDGWHLLPAGVGIGKKRSSPYVRKSPRSHHQDPDFLRIRRFYLKNRHQPSTCRICATTASPHRTY